MGWGTQIDRVTRGFIAMRSEILIPHDPAIHLYVIEFFVTMEQTPELPLAFISQLFLFTHLLHFLQMITSSVDLEMAANSSIITFRACYPGGRLSCSPVAATSVSKAESDWLYLSHVPNSLPIIVLKARQPF